MATAMACSHLVATPAGFSRPFSSSKSRFFSGSSNSTLSLGTSHVCTATTKSSDWMPGQPRPPYLDGSAPGDFGFDPLGLGAVPENLERYKESELIHCRWAMLAVQITRTYRFRARIVHLAPIASGDAHWGEEPGVLLPEALGLGNWIDAQRWAAEPGGQATYLGVPVPWGTLPIILIIEFLAIAFVENQRSIEPDIEKKKYPGGAFDPLGYSKDPAKFAEMKVKEVKNGRLAILAFVGFCVQASANPGTGPLENLAAHLSDPWHKNIAEVLIPRSVMPY